MARARGYDSETCRHDDVALLDQIVARCSSAGPGSVAVFDLDGCLFDTRPRQVRILRELAGQHGWPVLYRVREEHFVDWSLRRTLTLAGLDSAFIEANLDTLVKGWAPRFFSSAGVALDHALPGAPELVRAVHDTGVDVVYLTGRDERMRGGTEETLRLFGFPLDGPRATLMLKPRPELDDTQFKESTIAHLARIGDVVLYIDNEPANVNVFAKHHPEALVVFVETDHSPRPDEPLPGLPWLRSFLRVPIR